MTVVVDASVVVAGLVDAGQAGRWAEDVLCAGPLAAPHCMPAEVTSVLRKAVLAGDVSKESGAMAYADLPVQLYPFRPLASRIWELRSTVTAYDAWYVALAQALDAPLATLDARLRGAPGPRCRWLFAPADA